MVQFAILLVVILLVFANGKEDHADREKRERTINRFRIYIQGLNTNALPDNIRNRLKDLASVPLTVGITGESGVGKSSLINTLRNLTANDSKAAAVGVVEKTTQRLQYADPKNHELVYWDLPSCGTPDFSRENYLDKVNFDEYDFFFIVSSSRFTENDAWLAQEITKRKKEFFFVRNKVDIDLHNEKRDHPTRTETEILDEIRTNCIERLQTVTKLERRIYLISSVLSDQAKWDFNRLIRDYIDENRRLKQEILIDQLISFSQKEIKNKANELRSAILWHRVLGAFLSFVPGFGFLYQIYLIRNKPATYKMELLLDEKWLLSLIHSQPPQFEIISSQFFELDNIQYYIAQLTCCMVLYASTMVCICMSCDQRNQRDQRVFLVPRLVILQSISVVISFFMISYQLSSSIGNLEGSALDLIGRFV